MNIKVIKRGVVKESIPRTTDCIKCHSELEFVPSEVKRVFDQRDGDFYQFNCPVCNASVTVSVICTRL